MNVTISWPQYVGNCTRFQVLITQGFVELLVNAVIDAKCKNAKKITSNTRDFPYSTKLLILHELGLLSDSSEI